MKTFKTLGISVVAMILAVALYVVTKPASPLFFYDDNGYIELLDNPCLSDSSKKMMLMTISDSGIVTTAHGCYYVDSSSIVHLGGPTSTVPYKLSEFSHELPPLDIRGL